jgi:hypothetical protein
MDIRQIAFETPLMQESHYIERWKVWITVRELSGEERAELLQKSTDMIKKGNTTEARVNLKKLYPMLAILTTRYPDPACPPHDNHPHSSEFPGLKNAMGEYVTQPTEKAGELVFSPTDIGPLNKTSGAILEQISQIAAPMSGLRPEDVDEKKEGLNGTIVESDSYTFA